MHALKIYIVLYLFIKCLTHKIEKWGPYHLVFGQWDFFASDLDIFMQALHLAPSIRATSPRHLHWSASLGPCTAQRASHGPNSQTKRRKADCDNSHHPTLEVSSGPFTWCPPRVIPTTHKNWTHIEVPGPRASAEALWRKVAFWKALKINHNTRKDILEDQPERKISLAE